MGWDKGRYYTRSRKVNGRVVREYVGRGPAADLAAYVDSVAREIRAEEAANRKAAMDSLTQFDQDVRQLCQAADVLGRAVLVGSGYRQHKKGEWRKTRGQA